MDWRGTLKRGGLRRDGQGPGDYGVGGLGQGAFAIDWIAKGLNDHLGHVGSTSSGASSDLLGRKYFIPDMEKDWTVLVWVECGEGFSVLVEMMDGWGAAGRSRRRARHRLT
jgi:hypothetical protein